MFSQDATSKNLSSILTGLLKDIEKWGLKILTACLDVVGGGKSILI